MTTRPLFAKPAPPPETPPPARVVASGRFAPLLLSAVTPGQPVHAIRTGTFVDSRGREFTFTADDMRAMAANFAAMTPRRALPITESHDYGRAVGRMTQAWCSADGASLYVQPVWNAEGRRMLAEGVYDGFSCEIDNIGTPDICLFGGSLTNYPAVSGLQPVTLEAPVGIDVPDTQEDDTMPDEATVTTPAEAPPADLSAMVATAFQAANISGAMTEQFTALFSAQLQSQIAAAREQAKLEAQRQIAEFQARQSIASFAQHVTTPTLARPHALPLEAARVEAFLISLSAAQRPEAQAILSAVLDSGLVSFDELGAQGDDKNQPSAIERYEAALTAKLAQGLSRSAALSAINREQPALVNEYNAEKAKGGR